jgi:UDP-N-acetylmuramate--alanine ligase
MFLMGLDPSFLTGGLANRFISETSAGNFYKGSGGHFVFEADESDKSLVAYSPEYAMILNIGTDHYSKEEIIEVFQKFLSNVTKGAVMDEKVYELLGPDCVKGLDLRLFSSDIGSDSKADWRLTGYSASSEKVFARINDSIEILLPSPGVHSAANAAAILAAIDLMGCNPEGALDALSGFKGVWRRFDYAGRTEKGARVYDDYAHNVEKIASCISAAREICGGRVIAVFQPHGFGPLGFMKDELFSSLENNLSDNDIFAFLPVYYAGGTSSFKPSSEEVVSEYLKRGTKNYKYFDSRDEAVDFIQASASQEDVALVMGARDNSLSDWSEKIIANGTC